MGHPIRLNSVIARDTARGKRKVKLQWYHKNYLDHVYAVSDDNGNLVEHYRYTAFGEPEIYSATGARRNTSAIGNTVMWNTRRYDADNGLYYYKYRHYAANIGRWLGRDPIEEDGGINLYAFVENEPFGRFDRLGENAFALFIAGFVNIISNAFLEECSECPCTESGCDTCVKVIGTALHVSAQVGVVAATASCIAASGFFGTVACIGLAPSTSLILAGMIQESVNTQLSNCSNCDDCCEE